MLSSKVTSISVETIACGVSLVAGITGQPAQIGVMIGLRGATTVAWGGPVGGTHPTAASFFAACGNLNFQHQNIFPVAGHFYLGANAGVTALVDVTRFFKA
jgi:hypothetical protein